MATKKNTPAERQRAPKGSVGVKFLLSLPAELNEAARVAAEREGLSVTEWWRRAAVDRVARANQNDSGGTDRWGDRRK
jgi:predicted HicB family RNase H-like nuclease